jgi:vacuolar-type H+-ATPase subunit E/Vma4
MDSEIISQLTTTDEADLLTDELEALSVSLYKDHGGTFEKVLKERVRKRVGEKMVSEMKKKGIGKREYIKALKKQASSLEEVKLTLAVEPTPAMIESISDWIKENVGAAVILDLTFDATLVGGAVVSFRGNYADYSLRARLEKYRKEIDKRIKEAVGDKQEEG